MRHIVRYLDPVTADACVGVRTDDGVRPMATVVSIADLLRKSSGAIAEAVDATEGTPPKPDDITLLPPIDGRGEVWCTGVTYERSRSGRMEESGEPDIYDKVYTAARPELFGKAPAWRVVTDGEPIGIREDSGHDVPEPELALVCNSAGEIVGYTVCDDMSSRSLEGENPLYLPQAKVYAGSCALATGIVPAADVADPKDLTITLTIRRGSEVAFTERTSTSLITRDLQDLVEALFRAIDFPDGVILATGTGIVPPFSFALAAGDLVEIDIEGVGALSNPVVVGRDGFDALARGERPTA